MSNRNQVMLFVFPSNYPGSFLIVYFISMALCGIPIFVLEVAVGQYLGEGGMTLVGRLCPLLGGTGMATMVLVSLLNIYYCVIVGWAIFYLIVSLATLPHLPWDTCGQYRAQARPLPASDSLICTEAWWNTEKCLNFNSTLDGVRENMTEVKTPVEEYWR